MTEPIRSIFVESRGWHDNSSGSSYFSNRIWVNGDIILETPLQYGYETQYLWDALKRLYEAGLIVEPQSPYSLRQKIDLYHCQQSVPKRQMFKGTDLDEDLLERFEPIQ